LRYLFQLLFLFTTLWLSAQHHYEYELVLEKANQLNGKASIWLVNGTGNDLSTVYLHLPPRALSWKGSYFHQQYLEFQKTDLHYATREETGGIEIISAQILRSGETSFTEVTTCEFCEFADYPLEKVLPPGDSILLQIDFSIDLPEKDWLGSYSAKSEILITDWLPEIPPLDSIGFHLNPVTWQRDRYCQNNYYQINLLLPDSLIVATNATLETPEEKLLLDQQADRAFSKRPSTNSNKSLAFKHFGTGLQFVISPSFNVFRMGNGGLLYMQRKDPFLPYALDSVQQRINRFMSAETGLVLADKHDLVILDKFRGHHQSDRLISMAHPGTLFELSRELCYARFQSAIRYRNNMDGFQNVWLARGIPYYYKYRFIEDQYPDEFWTPWQDLYTDQFWQPFAHSVSGWILSLNKFEYAYQNQYLYLFLARQGLDQPLSTPADSLTRLNYGAVPLAKSYLAFNHLSIYAGARNFRRGMNRFLSNTENTAVQDLHKSMAFYHNRDLDWFFEEWINSEEIYDYQLKKYDYCPTIATARIKNKGRLNLPYSLTGYKNGEPVITEWFEGHDSVKNKQIYHEDYDMLRLNDHGRNAEWNLKNNYYRKGLFPHLKPLKVQFYQTFEDPQSTQVFWMPNLGYNAYDKVLLQLDLYNYGLVTRPWEWYVGPSFSTGTGKLTGSASLERNFVPRASSMFHRISGGLYFRYYHYDRDLAFFRISPSVSFRFRKPYPRSTILQRFRIRAVHLERELPPEFQGVANDISNASYTVLNLTHRYEETRLIKPYTIRTDLLVGNQFSRIDMTADFRWMLPNRKWFIWRSFGGLFLSNDFSSLENQQNYFSLGLSGTQDFMFDYYFIGRSDETGVWSRQFFVTDGGFKTGTEVYANNWMLATNVNLPVWQIFGLFGDVALLDGANQIHYDYGIRVAFLTDFFEIYFPLGYNDQFFPNEFNYAGNIRYVLNLDLDAILHRLRRGYY
jgi:hypothetical protein